MLQCCQGRNFFAFFLHCFNSKAGGPKLACTCQSKLKISNQIVNTQTHKQNQNSNSCCWLFYLTGQRDDLKGTLIKTFKEKNIQKLMYSDNQSVSVPHSTVFFFAPHNFFFRLLCGCHAIGVSPVRDNMIYGVSWWTLPADRLIALHIVILTAHIKLRGKSDLIYLV